MKRRCSRVKPEWIKDVRINPDSPKVTLFYDCANEEEIKEIFEDESLGNKLRVSLFYVLNGIYEEDHYDHERVSEKAKNVTAIKLKGKKGGNLRIVCKEFLQDGKKVVAVTAVRKKKQKVDAQLRALYETVGGYNYDFED